MNRRSTLKTLAAAGGGIAGLSLVEWKWHIVEDLLDDAFFNRRERELISSIANTIIPAGPAKAVPGTSEPQLIGALSTGTDKYLMKLIEKCYEKQVQEMVKLQLAALDKKARKTMGDPFAGCSQQQREQLLQALDTSAVEDEKEFFDLFKSETIRGFTTCQEVMVNYLEYKVAPGFYEGCATVAKS